MPDARCPMPDAGPATSARPTYAKHGQGFPIATGRRDLGAKRGTQAKKNRAGKGAVFS